MARRRSGLAEPGAGCGDRRRPRLHPARPGRRALPHRHRPGRRADRERRAGPGAGADRPGGRRTGYSGCGLAVRVPAARRRSRHSPSGASWSSRRTAAPLSQGHRRGSAGRASGRRGNPAGRTRHRLGQARRRLARPRSRRPRARWDDATLVAAVQAAHAAGVRITAHCFEEQSVATLVRAGIDCVEHGTGLSADVITEMAERGTAWSRR